jgi:DNA polymerase-3 subunit gamma/tau
MDLIEIDAASNTSVEDVRDLREKINYAPTQGAYKVYIIDEVHMLSTAAFNALLKTLEEPPGHAIFILATTEVHKIPATVLSRCQRHEFRRIGVTEISRHLKELARQENLVVEPEVLTLIARQATGAMRDAISLLDQLSSTGEGITLEIAHQVLGTATNAAVIELVDALLKKEPARGLEQIHTALDAGADSRQFARQVVEYLRNLMILKLGGDEQLEVSTEVRARMAGHAQAFTPTLLIQCIRSFNNAATDLRGGWQPGLLLELAFAENLREPEAVQPTVEASQPSRSPQKAPPQTTTNAPATETRPVTPAVQSPEGRAAEAEPAADPDAQPPGDGTITFPGLLQQWPRIRALIKKHSPQTEALINSSKLMGIKDGVLLLAFSPVLRQKMETGTHLDITARAISHVTGINLEVRCSLLSGKAETNLPPDADVEDDGIVGTAMRDLGGKVVDIQ